MQLKTIILFLIFYILFSPGLKSQTVLIEDEDPEKIYQETNWGPNKQHFGYFFVNLGYPVPIESRNNLEIGKSGHWNLGYTYKLKLIKFADLGTELSYSNYYYALNKDNRKVFNSSKDWDKIRSRQNGIKGNMFLRFYLNKKRGNYFGGYIDLGFFVDYSFSSGWIYKLKGGDLKIRRSEDTDDFEELIYGPSFSFGRNKISMFAQYNINDIISDDASNIPFQMPHYIFGFKLNLYSAY